MQIRADCNWLRQNTVVSIAKVIAVAIAMVGVSSSSATAVPGEISSTTRLSNTTYNANGSNVLFSPGGNYLAFRNTDVLSIDKGGVLLVERRTVRIRKFSGSGKIDEKFDRSPVGRGVTIGRKDEIVEFRQIAHVSGSSYVAWVTTNGDVHSGGSATWPRTALIAFNGGTGELLPSFGKGGILIYGAHFTDYARFGRSEADGFAVLPDGRMLFCGRNETYPPLRYRQYVATASLDSVDARPFFVSNSFTSEPAPSDNGAPYKSCARAVLQRDGSILTAGYSASDARFADAEPWVAAYEADGSRDDSFGGDGQVAFAAGVTETVRHSMQILAFNVTNDGKILVGGSQQPDARSGFVARLNANGSPDETFGERGFLWLPRFTVTDVWGRADGSVVLTGSTPRLHPVVGSLTSGGHWDRNFLGKGWHAYANGYSAGPRRIPGSSGIQLWGWYSPRKSTRLAVVRITSKTTFDASISSVKYARGLVHASGYASSQSGAPLVRVGVGTEASAPSRWSLARGANRWSTRIRTHMSSRKRVLYACAVTSSTEAVDAEKCDRKRLPGS